MTVFLHIGSEKTGSTALQNFLGQHRMALREQSTLFPKTMGDPNNFALALLMKASLEDRRVLNKWFRYDGIEDPSFEDLCLDRLNRMDRIQDYENIVFSSEHVFSQSTDMESVARLVTFLSKISPDIKVIVYLRPLHKLVVSLLSSRIRSGGTPSLSDIIEHTAWIEYDKILEKYCTLLGRENVLIRKYQHGDTIPDFLTTIGVDLPAASGKSDRKNTSLGQAQLNVLRQLNRKIPAFIDGEPNTLRTGLPDFVATRAEFDPVYLDQDTLNFLRDRLGAANERLMRDFIDDPDFLIPDVASPPSRSTPAPDREDILLQLFVNLWEEHKAQQGQQHDGLRVALAKALRAAKKRGRRLLN